MRSHMEGNKQQISQTVDRERRQESESYNHPCQAPNLSEHRKLSHILW
jgi:hypothetical protein